MTAPTTPARAGQARVSDEQIAKDIDHVARFGMTARDMLMLPAAYIAALRDERAGTARLRADLAAAKSRISDDAIQVPRWEFSRMEDELAAANARADKAERERDEARSYLHDAVESLLSDNSKLTVRIGEQATRIAELEKELVEALKAQRTDRRKAVIREVVTWLHERANEMTNPHARGILNGAALYVGERGGADRETGEKHDAAG